jgi:hypothetical protein
MMRLSMRTITRRAIPALVAAAAVATAVLLLSGGASSPTDGSKPAAKRAAPAIVALDADGPSFATLAALQSSAELVAKGTPLSKSASQLAGGLPQTLYKVRVEDVAQGDVALVGTTITVALLGGTSNGTIYEADGLKPLKIGARQIFFLAKSGGASWYPVGGAAVAPLTAKGTFTLGANVTGGAPLRSSLSAVSCKGKPKGVVSVKARGGKASAKLVGVSKRRIGSSATKTYKVKLIRGCSVAASGTVRGKSLRLSVRPGPKKGKRVTYRKLRGLFVLLPNGGRAAIKPVRVSIR